MRLTPLALFLALAACSEKSTGPDPNPPADELTILGSVMGGNYQNLSIYRGTEPVNNATVTVNGTNIPSNGPGRYYGKLSTPVAEGGALTLVVSDSDLEATGTATVPSIPEITSVTGTVAGGLDVRWSAATNPDSFQVSLNYTVNNAGTAQRFMAPGGARQRSFTAAPLPANATDLIVRVYSYNAGSFVGDATANSRMNVRSQSGSTPVN